MRIEKHYCTTNKMGITHCMARCSQCAWEDAIGDGKTRKGVKARAKAHVRQTGHSVTVEEASSIHYTAF